MALLEPDTVPVTVSNKWFAHTFKCSLDYILSTCKGRCCRNYPLIPLLPEEEGFFKPSEIPVVDGFIVTPKVCLFQHPSGRCVLHDIGRKPFSCATSPFLLSSKNTITIARRYTAKNCHGDGLPACQAFRFALDTLVGEDAAEDISSRWLAGERNICVEMPIEKYNAARYVAEKKREWKRRSAGSKK